MSRVHLSDNILLVSDMGKIASKMLPTLTSIRPQQQRQQHQPQGEVVKMDVEDIINNKHGLTEDEDCILEHDNKKMKLMVDGESFVKVGVRKALRHNKKQLTQQISLVFTEGQEDEVVHKHKQPSHQVNEAKPELFASEESARGGDVQCADACAVSLEGDSECGPVPELPIEILNSVFEYVRLQDRCAASMTCRSWHVAAWQCVSTMEFNMRHRPEQDTIIASIVRRCPNIRHVTLRDCFSVTGRLLRCLPMTVQSFQFFNCPNFVKTLQNDDIKYLSRDMLSLSLGNCENISDDGVSSLPSSLKHLEMCGSKISEAGISSLPRTLKSLVLKRSQVAITSLSALPATLVSLDVSNCHLEANALLALPKSLVTLSLVGCVTVTDQHLEQLSTCSELQTLLLDGCDRVTFKGIEALPQSMKSLSIKNCAGVNDRALSALPRGIRDLTIWKCKNVTKLAFSRLPSTLVSLKLVHTPVADECIGMLPNTLKRLSLFGCSQITDAAMQVLPPLVSDLDLSWTPVTDSGICHLTRLTKLTKVNLSNTKVSREGIIVLENTVPALTVLKGYCD